MFVLLFAIYYLYVSGAIDIYYGAIYIWLKLWYVRAVLCLSYVYYYLYVYIYMELYLFGAVYDGAMLISGYTIYRYLELLSIYIMELYIFGWSCFMLELFYV